MSSTITRHFRKSRPLHGFTLIELLVVISVVAMLIALLLPALGAARDAGRTAVCLSNVRALSQAGIMFLDAERDMFPHLDAIPYGTWMLSLHYYLDASIDAYRLCPKAPTPLAGGVTGTADRAWQMPEAWGHTLNGVPWTITASYGLNGFLYSNKSFGGAGAHWANNSAFPDAWWGTVGNVTKPSMTPIFGDCNWRDAHPHETNPMPPDFRRDRGYRWNESPANGFGHWMLGRYALDRHNDRVNIAFIDGHAASTQIPDLWSLQWSRTFQPTANPTVGP